MPTKCKFAVIFCSAWKASGAWWLGGRLSIWLNWLQYRSDEHRLFDVVNSQQPSYPVLSLKLWQQCVGAEFIVGGYRQGGIGTKTALTCSLSTLLQSQKTQSVWCANADLYPCPIPDLCSTKWMAMGTKNINLYNTEANSWEVNCQMFTYQQLCLVTVLPSNKLMVARGQKVSDIQHHDWYSSVTLMCIAI